MKASYAIQFLLLLSVCLMATEDAFCQRGCRPVKPGHQASARRQARAARAATTNPYVGSRRQLTVLVSFSDQGFKEADPLPRWERIFNEHGLQEAPFHGSVHDYFYAQSNGLFDLTFDLYYVPLNEGRRKYRSTSADDENSKYLVNDLLDSLEKRQIDWSLYDWDGDGYVDQLLIVYAGKGQNDTYDTNAIWPHQWWLSMHDDCEARAVSSGGRNYLVDAYCCVQEQTASGSYGTFGTICHEYTHCFGFPDYYNGTTQYVGRWDLMDYGNNNGSGFCPPNYSAHERMLMGWATPVELTGPARVSNMAAGESYLIRNSGYDNEYYIVENRQRTGWDESLPGSGLVVFHIDYDADLWVSVDEMANTTARQHYTLFYANNSRSSANQAGWAYPYAANDSLTDTSRPAASLWHANAEGTRLMSKPLSNMAVRGGVASFDFMGGTPSAVASPSAGQQAPSVLYDLGPIYIIRYPNGEIRKIMK